MRKIALFSAVVFLAAAPVVWCADETAPQTEAPEDTNFHYQTKMTKEGLFFRVPEDMPIERRGGLQVPMQFDEYMYGKFKQLDDTLKEIGARLGHIESMLTEIKGNQERQRKLQA